MMKDTQLIPMSFESSNGILLVNEDGTVHKDSDLSGWLLEIFRVDMEELDNYYSINMRGKCDGGDVLDFGWWNKEGEYNMPERDWRIVTFHNQDFNEGEVGDVVDQSFQWIDNNRNTTNN